MFLGRVCVCVFFFCLPDSNMSLVSSASASKSCDCLKVGHCHFCSLLSTYNSHTVPQFDDKISVKAFLNKQRHDQVYVNAFSMALSSYYSHLLSFS